VTFRIKNPESSFARCPRSDVPRTRSDPRWRVRRAKDERRVRRGRASFRVVSDRRTRKRRRGPSRSRTRSGEDDRVTTVEGGGAVRGVVVDPGDDAAMMAYGGTAGNGGAMGPSSGGGGGGGGGGGADVLSTAASDYSPQSTPTPLTGHSTTGGTVENAYTPGTTGAASYSPQDSPASSAGGSGNGQLPSFGFTQEQVACVCEVSRVIARFVELLRQEARKPHRVRTRSAEVADAKCSSQTQTRQLIRSVSNDCRVCELRFAIYVDQAWHAGPKETESLLEDCREKR